MTNTEPKPDLVKLLKAAAQVLVGLFAVVVLLLTTTITLMYNPPWLQQALAPTVNAPAPAPLASSINPNDVVNGVHQPTGFVEAEGLAVVVQHCTACHSAKLVTQNRATKEGWQAMIQWMQATQGLWPLGNNEAIIINYLASNYAPEQEGRRRNLSNIEWYELTQ